MNVRKGSSVVFFAILVLASLVTASGQKTKSGNTTVTTIVHDYDSTGNEVLMRSDDYNGTGEATYTGATIPNGEWDLILYNQSVRTLWVTPDEPVGSEPAAPLPGYFSEGVQTSSRCFDQNGNTVPLANVVTSSGNCKLGVNFDSGGTLYKLLMSPFPFSASGDGTATCPSTGCPATGSVTVTCNKVSNTECVSWTIAPNTTAPNASVANLYRYESSKRSATWLFLGQYYNTFRIDVTNP
jgi:hypothetical protein